MPTHVSQAFARQLARPVARETEESAAEGEATDGGRGHHRHGGHDQREAAHVV